MENDGPMEPSIDFIPAICFVKRGIAKQNPEKVVLTPAELAKVIKETKEEIQSDEGDTDADEEENEMQTSDNENVNHTDEYNFNQYDEEGGSQVAGIGNIAVLDDSALVDDEDDSEAEDDIIKPSDNLLLVGHVSDDSATMEVWVFNEEEESLYSHHDFMLPSFPLCIEWLHHDPGSDKQGNMCAIGCMDPVISIWDLDIQDSFVPVFKLGSKGSRKKNKPKYGHEDAVLTLSWNIEYSHILSSGSVDKTVILWDLDKAMPHTTIKSFEEKVQSIAFHPTEGQVLLTGCSDGKVRLFDCLNSENSVQEWGLGSEVEKVVWNPSDPNFFIAGANDGKLYYADLRNPGKFSWTTEAHTEEVSGICFNSEVKGLLTTTASDGLLKIWKFSETAVEKIYQHDFSLGRVQCMAQSPDNPFTLVIGGEKPPRFRVYNIKNFEAVRAKFNLESMDSGE